MAQQHHNEFEEGWLQREGAAAVDDAGAVVLAWRTAAGRAQTEVASQLGIAAEDPGLSSVSARKLVSRDDASPQIAASRLRWREERHWLNQHRRELGALVARLYPVEYRLPHTTVIAPDGWLPSAPVELGSLALRLDETPRAVGVDGSEPESAATRPMRTVGLRFERYTSAIKHLSPPALFWNSPSYRLLDASLASRRLEFTLATYFDRLDVCEALGHEVAAVCMAEGLPGSPENLRGRLPFRELVGDPFDLLRRAVNPGFATLTIRLRRYPAEPSFLLHWRDPAKVATAGGVYGVIPTGEFEPSSVALWNRRNDFDLWRNIVREYSEELLGEPEHDGTRSQPIDYEHWPLFQRLQVARENGTVGVFFLGLGLDALTLTAGILTVMVIDDDVFTELFGSMVRYNDEGEIVAVGGRTPVEGVPFTEAVVRRMLETEPMAESGSACLALAWRHRDALGL